MVRRAAELAVGMGLLLGPLAYALTLEPEVETEVVVVHEAAPSALFEDSEPVVPVVEPTVEVERAPVAEPESTEPELEPTIDANDRIQFAFVNEAGLVLSTAAETTWGKGRLRRHAGPGMFRAAKRADASTVPEHLWAQRGRTFDLYGAEGKLCTVRLGDLHVLAQHDGPSKFDLFHPDSYYADGDWEAFEKDPASAAETRAQVWSLAEKNAESEYTNVLPWLVAEIVGDDACDGALWARDSALPSPALLHVTDEPSALTERRAAQLYASEELTEIRELYEEFLGELDDEGREYYGTWERLAAEHPATVRTWVDAEGNPRLLETHFGTSEGSCGDGHYSELSAFDAVDGDTLTPIERSIEPAAVFDIDLDGQYEFLYRYDYENGGVLRSETLGHSWDIDAVFLCPC